MNDAAKKEYPLVSAIMLAGRMSQFDIFAAIQCFKAQTYPYKELIVLNNAKSQFAASGLNLQAEKDIFLIDTPTDLNAGMARNYGIKAANGRILAQFDADYWHDPKRLEAQIATLAENESHICVLSETLLYSYVSGYACLHTNHKEAILGTMVFVRPSNVDYPPVAKNEEYGILDRMVKAGMKPISMAKPELCCKLLFTSGEEVDEPENRDLNKKRFQIVKRIVEGRSALKRGEVPVPSDQKSADQQNQESMSDDD